MERKKVVEKFDQAWVQYPSLSKYDDVDHLVDDLVSAAMQLLVAERTDTLNEAAQIAKAARLGSGQHRRWKVAGEIEDAILALTQPAPRADTE